MVKTNALVAALTATTLMTAGIALAAEQAAPPAPSPAQTKANADLDMLSKDGANAYLDVAAARLAIFDGRTADAKKLASEADSAFDKAKTDRTVFMKAEADLKAPTSAMKSANDKAAKEAPADTAGGTDMKMPVAWLPVDGDVMLNEDFKAHPEKAAAVKEANKSLETGDKKGALAKLKLADVNITTVVAVVPLKATLNDVHQAAQDIGDGKYYEGSQLLRTVQNSTRYDVFDMNAAPKANAAGTGSQGSHEPGTKTN